MGGWEDGRTGGWEDGGTGGTFNKEGKRMNKERSVTWFKHKCKRVYEALTQIRLLWYSLSQCHNVTILLSPLATRHSPSRYSLLATLLSLYSHLTCIGNLVFGSAFPVIPLIEPCTLNTVRENGFHNRFFKLSLGAKREVVVLKFHRVDHHPHNLY